MIHPDPPAHESDAVPATEPACAHDHGHEGHAHPGSDAPRTAGLHHGGHAHDHAGGNGSRIWAELRHHLPYSILSVIGSIMVMAVLTRFVHADGLEFLFHVFHPVHILLSATATTAMFWIHDRSPVKAVLIGALGSLPLCGLSDIFIPFLGGQLFGTEMHLHVCAIEEPWIVYPFLLVGIVTGLIAGEYVHRSTIYSHAGHVAVSSMASILYLLGFGMTDWIAVIGAVLGILLVAVMVPCVISDIVLPLMFARGHRCEHVRDLDAI